MRKRIWKLVAMVSFAFAVSTFVFCSSGQAGADLTKVQGHVYHGNGDVVVIEFKANGKAFVSTGPVSTPCSYSQSGGTVTLICEKDKTVFKVDPEDGALIGPPDGFLGRLTRKQ